MPSAPPAENEGESATGVAGATCAGADVAGSAPDIEFPPLSRLLMGPTTIQNVAPPAVSGGTLLVLSDDRTAVATDPDRDLVYVIDLPNRRLTATVTLQDSDEPGRLTEDGRGQVHVALRRGGALVTLDPTAGVVTGRRAVCAAPRGLAYDSRADLVHVACAGGELVSLPSAGGGALRTLHLDRDLRDVVVDGTELRVSRFRSSEILTVSAIGVVAQRTTPGSFRSVAARGGHLFTPSLAWRMVAVPGGGLAMVHQRGVTDEVQRGRPGSYGGARPCNAIVHSAVTRFGRDGTVVAGAPLAEFPLPVDIALSADGERAAVISAGNGHSLSATAGRASSSVHVAALGRLSNERTGCQAEAGRSPCGHLVDSGEAVARCSDIVPEVVGEAIAVAFTRSGAVIVQSREPAVLNVPGGAPIELGLETRHDTGHMLFHANAGGGLACASCHAEGSDDGRVWNFGCDGARRTQSLQTGIRGSEPLHWKGDVKDFAQLVREVFTSQMSGPVLHADDGEAVLSWLDHQRPPLPPAKGQVDANAVQRGRSLFNDPARAGCASCHAGASLTNGETTDVGTGGAFQVPSLVGLANHPPFMHDGCAATLRERFSPSCGGGDRHGKTSGLSSAELADLVLYLETL